MQKRSGNIGIHETLMNTPYDGFMMQPHNHAPTVPLPFEGAEGSANLETLKQEIERRRRTEERLHFLATATTIMINATLDYETRFKNLTRIIVPHFADWCMIDIAEKRQSYNVITMHSDPEKVALAEEIQKKYPPKHDAEYGIARVVRTGEPELHPDITDELMRKTTQSEEHYNLIKRLGISSVMLVPMIARGKSIGGITFVVGESGRRYNEEDLEFAKQLVYRAAVALDNAILHEELLDANRAKEKFLAMLAHELRNPLTPIRNTIPLIKEYGAEHAELREIAVTMERQIQTMTRLLDDLFDVARITEGKIQFQMETVDLLALAESTVAAYRHELEEKGLKFSVKLGDGPLFIVADRVRIEQVVVNLLNNAAKYTPEGGEISLECFREGDEGVIRVRDTGKGIPQHMLDNIFVLFTQIEQSIDRPEGGLGLGLTLVKSLVERHGGSVEASSGGLGKGSLFTVRLPLHEPASGGSSPAPRVSAAADIPRRILVVDDNIDAARSIAKLFARLGHTIEVAYDGPAAITAAGAFKPEVILLDIGLPGINGYDTARALRDTYGDQVLLIAVSGYGQEEDRQKAKSAGFDHHLVKPFDTQELRDLMNAWKQ